MTHYLKEYIKNITAAIDGAGKGDFERLMRLHLDKISFFQHERLVHLIVMALFAVLFITSFLAAIISKELSVLILSALFLVLLIPYIKHYYFLENSVQSLYRLYDKLYEKAAANMPESNTKL